MRHVLLVTALLAQGATAALARPAGAIAPYLQAGTPTSMTVMWRSATPVVGRLSWVERDGSALARTTTGPLATLHQIRLEGLRPGQEYRYEAFDGPQSVGGGTFRANPPASQTSFHFAAMGDSGSGSVHQFNVARQLTQRRPDFVVHCGDVVYERGEAENFAPRFFTPYQELVAHAVIYPSLGNHDYRTAQAANYLSFFEAPRPQPTDTERWYTFSYGHAQFFALDTNAPFGAGSAQQAWLAAQLKASSARWKIAFFHHPPYSSGEHGDSVYVQQAFGPLFERHHVQLVIAGHDHDYERFKPVRGVTYLVTGGAGAWLRRIRPRANTVVAQAAWHFVDFELNGARLEGRAIDEAGAEIDRFQVNEN